MQQISPEFEFGLAISLIIIMISALLEKLNQYIQ